MGGIRALSAICTAPPACRCSPSGAAEAQCHKNGTCVCRPGFVGYKCDRCRENFFLTAGGTHCQECPSCYGLVKEEVSPPIRAPPRKSRPASRHITLLPPPHRERQLCAGHRELTSHPWLSGLLGPLVTFSLCSPSHLADASPAQPSPLLAPGS